MNSSHETFKSFGLSDNTIQALIDKWFTKFSPIQEQTIPLLLKGEKDIIGIAQTGTGKTAAFGVPLIERLQEKTSHIQALILVPTRELALQVTAEIDSLKGKKKLKVITVYGGQPVWEQTKKLKGPVDIVVGTPGRVIDLFGRGALKCDQISYFVLDEADEMMNMGFIEDIEKILENTNKDKTMLCFSATMPKSVLKITQKYMAEHDMITIAKENKSNELTEQIYFEISGRDKFEALCRIIDIEPDFYGLIFCRTKIETDTIANRLAENGYHSDALHGDILQTQREKILNKFKKKTINILVATDVAARGIDINDLTHVINYSLPQDPESYVHRIGRTGRAGKKGTAITFVTPQDRRGLNFIKKVAKIDITRKELPQAHEIVGAKINKLKTDLSQLISDEKHTPYLELADSILADQDPKHALAGIIKHSFGKDFDQNNYKNIEKVNIARSSDGNTRLFIAKGKEDGMNLRKIIELIQEDVSIDSSKIRNISVLDNFSFADLPTDEADIVITLAKKKSSRRPLITKAKERSNGPRDNNRSRGGNYGRSSSGGGWFRRGNRGGSSSRWGSRSGSNQRSDSRSSRGDSSSNRNNQNKPQNRSSFW